MGEKARGPSRVVRPAPLPLRHLHIVPRARRSVTVALSSNYEKRSSAGDVQLCITRAEGERDASK